MKVADGEFLLIARGNLISSDHAGEQGDVLVCGERIEQVAPRITRRQGWKMIDARGKLVAPGFMNIHSHADFHVPIPEHALLYDRLLAQGITTNVGGQCGFAFFPLNANRRQELDDYQGFMRYRDFEPTWTSCDSYLASLEGKLSFNYAQLAAHGTMRVSAAGFRGRISNAEMKAMSRTLEESLEAGCFGFSSGLMYMPGTFADTDELLTLAKVARRHPGAFYASHLRGYSATFIEAVQEAIRIGREANVPVQVSHLGPFGVKNGHKIPIVLKLMEKARREGVDVAYDSLGYCGSDTLAIALFPPQSYSRGLERFLADIRDDSFWNGVVRKLQTYVPQWPSWEGNGWTDNFVECCGIENISVLGARNPEFIGQSFVALGEEWAVDPWEALRRVVLAERADFKILIDGIGGDLYGNAEQPNFDAMIEHPLCIDSVDEVFDRNGRSWLEAWGSFPHVVQRYVLQKKTITLQAMIQRFTAGVAARLGIVDRGYLRRGCFADIVVLDLENYCDHPSLTVEGPQRATGVEQLLINGCFAIENGSPTHAFPGHVLRAK